MPDLSIIVSAIVLISFRSQYGYITGAIAITLTKKIDIKVKSSKLSFNLLICFWLIYYTPSRYFPHTS